MHIVFNFPALISLLCVIISGLALWYSIWWSIVSACQPCCWQSR